MRFSSTPSTLLAPTLSSRQFVGRLLRQRRCVREIVEAETYDIHGDSQGTWASLNVPAFKHLLGRVDAVSERAGHSYSVVHDRTCQFEAALSWAQQASKSSRAATATLIAGRGAMLRPLLSSATSFATDDSDAEPALQAADLLATTIGKAATKAVAQGWPRTEDWYHLVTPLLMKLLVDEEVGYPLFAGMYVAPTTEAALTQMMVLGIRHMRSQ